MSDDGGFTSFSQEFNWVGTDKVLPGLRRLMAVMDAVVLPLMGSKADYDEAVLRFGSILSERFAEDIQPLFDAITQDAQLGAIFMTTSATPVTAGLGPRLFDVAVGDRLKYAAPGFIAVVSKADPSIAMLGVLGGFDRDEGVLALNVTTVSGVGRQAADWQIVATPPPFVPVGFNAGSYDGSAPVAGIPYVSGIPNVTGGIKGGSY